jgi:hypothetical protein
LRGLEGRGLEGREVYVPLDANMRCVCVWWVWGLIGGVLEGGFGGPGGLGGRRRGGSTRPLMPECAEGGLGLIGSVRAGFGGWGWGGRLPPQTTPPHPNSQPQKPQTPTYKTL